MKQLAQRATTGEWQVGPEPSRVQRRSSSSRFPGSEDSVSVSLCIDTACEPTDSWRPHCTSQLRPKKAAARPPGQCLAMRATAPGPRSPAHSCARSKDPCVRRGTAGRDNVPLSSPCAPADPSPKAFCFHKHSSKRIQIENGS